MISLGTDDQQWSWWKGWMLPGRRMTPAERRKHSQLFPGFSGKGMRRREKGEQRTGLPSTSEMLPSPTASEVSQVREEERLLVACRVLAIRERPCREQQDVRSH